MIPLEPLDLSKVTSIDSLVRAMAKTAFTGRQLGEAADVLEAMALDEDAFIVMTLAGAMTVAKQGLIVTELIDRGIVNAIVSTGALMAHGLVEASGRAHFRANPEVSDEELYEQGYNRVYDTLEPEQNLDDVEEVMSAVLEAWDHNDIMCSYKLNHAIGAYLSKHAQGQRGILKSAYEKGVPVFVPAFSDSELGLDTALNNRLRESTGRHKIRFDPFEDLEHFAATLLRQKKLGIFTIGGGVPRNWSQQFGPFCELRHRRLGENVPLKRYHYGLRICPEPVYSGWIVGRSLQRSHFLGQVRTSGRRRQIRRSFCGRDRRAADHRGCSSGAPRQSEEGQQRTQGCESGCEKVGDRPLQGRERGSLNGILLPNSQNRDGLRGRVHRRRNRELGGLRRYLRLPSPDSSARRAADTEVQEYCFQGLQTQPGNQSFRSCPSFWPRVSYSCLARDRTFRSTRFAMSARCFFLRVSISKVLLQSVSFLPLQ